MVYIVCMYIGSWFKIKTENDVTNYWFIIIYKLTYQPYLVVEEARETEY